MSARKPRSDAKLKSLPPHQREMLVRWLVEENVDYKTAKERLAQDFGVTTSVGALANFYATECWQESSAQAREFADEAVRLAKTGGADFDTATLALIQERAFIHARTKNSDVKDLALLAGIIGDSARLRLKARELELNVEKFRQTVKADIDKGLDALHAEIQGNPEALALFEKFKAAVLRSTEGKA